VILSDRDLKQLLDSGRLVVEPFQEGSIQPSSIDLRVGNQFRIFANSRHPFIDVKKPMEGLTELVETTGDEPFILHPGEFVLGTTLERVSLPDDIVGRIEGKSSLGRLGLLIHSSLPEGEVILFRDEHGVTSWRCIEEIVRKSLAGDVVSFDPESLEVGFHRITGTFEGPMDRIYEVLLASGRRVRVTAGHNLFTLDFKGEIRKLRTSELNAGTLVAIPGRLPAPQSSDSAFVLGSLATDDDYQNLVFEGDEIERLFAKERGRAAKLLMEAGIHHVNYYRARSRFPAWLARQLIDPLSSSLRVSVRGSSRSLPNRLPVDEDLAWLLGLYVAEGSHRPQQVTWSNTNQAILDRVQSTLTKLGLPVYRSQGSITCASTLLSMFMGWIGVGDGAYHKRIPPAVFGWSDELVRSFLEGFVDGDGSWERTRISLWTCSEGLVADFLSLLPRLGMRASASERRRGTGRLFQISIPHREHKLLTSLPLPHELLIELRKAIGWSQKDASIRCGYRYPTDLCNIETRRGRDAIRLHTVRRLLASYEVDGAHLDQFRRLASLAKGEVLWDRVVDVRDTGAEEVVFDLEVRPAGRRIENFLAGSGGVFVSNTAGYVDAGFNGHLTLELSNVANLPITIYPGMKIGQLCLFEMTSPAEHPYGSPELGSKYAGQVGPTPSRYFENFDEETRSSG
jgi:deoxycytidine triphosphate deaminase/intein/homing endonuclease